MGMLISSILFYFMSSVTLKVYPLLVELGGIAGTLMIFAALSFICAALMLMIVPETKGKSFEQIKRMMEN